VPGRVYARRPRPASAADVTTSESISPLKVARPIAPPHSSVGQPTPPAAPTAAKYGADWLGVEVVDEGNGATPHEARSTPGRGLIGMRERAALLGGTIAARPEPAGGFRVECKLPLAEA
jgi:hypothetical protein